MSSSKICRNPAMARPGNNNDRPSGASSLAAATSPGQLMKAAAYGNRATRRLALKNLRKLGYREAAD
jgi:hypothetical protein